MKRSPESGSLATTLPTAVPLAAFSATEPPLRVRSSGASFKLLRLIVKRSIKVLESEPTA